jgi:ketosteroid isomerase-like protein
MSERITTFLAQWTNAERDGDADTLATLLTDDFCGVGPLGFILPRPAWLDRYRQGLTYTQFSLEEVQIRLHGDVGVVTARIAARGTFGGQPLPEALRATLVVASGADEERLVSIHMSFIAGTEGSPSLPGQPNSAAGSAAANTDRREP